MTRQEYEAELEKLQMRAYIELLMPDEYEKELSKLLKQYSCEAQHERI